MIKRYEKHGEDIVAVCDVLGKEVMLSLDENQIRLVESEIDEKCEKRDARIEEYSDTKTLRDAKLNQIKVLQEEVANIEANSLPNLKVDIEKDQEDINFYTPAFDYYFVEEDDEEVSSQE